MDSSVSRKDEICACAITFQLASTSLRVIMAWLSKQNSYQIIFWIKAWNSTSTGDSKFYRNTVKTVGDQTPKCVVVDTVLTLCNCAIHGLIAVVMEILIRLFLSNWITTVTKSLTVRYLKCNSGILMLNTRYRRNYGQIWIIMYETEGEKIFTQILLFLIICYIYWRDK
jgi:hypothetical protein